MILCIDVGNTNISIGVVDNNRIVKVFQISTKINMSSDEYALKLKEFVKNCELDNTITGAIVSSVVPRIDSKIDEAIEKQFDVIPLKVQSGIKTGISIKIDDPKQLGADLLIGAVACHDKYPNNAIVVDMGTATKFVIVNEKGELLGGAIAPGIIGSLESLISLTAKLPEVNLIQPKCVLGRNTITCIQSGSIYGTSSMIEGMVKRFEKEIGPLEVILTGGNAIFVKDALQIPFHYEPELLINGLILLYNKNTN